MKKTKNIMLVTTAFFCLLSATDSIAQPTDHICPDGELALEFPQINSWPHFKTKKIRIHSTIETPNAYSADLVLDKTHEQTTYLTLHLIAPNTVAESSETELQETKSLEHPTTIDQTLEIPVTTDGIFIDVIKDYSGSPEYFKADFNFYQPLCLQPEMYK